MRELRSDFEKCKSRKSNNNFVVIFSFRSQRVNSLEFNPKSFRPVGYYFVHSGIKKNLSSFLFNFSNNSFCKLQESSLRIGEGGSSFFNSRPEPTKRNVMSVFS